MARAVYQVTVRLRKTSTPTRKYRKDGEGMPDRRGPRRCLYTHIGMGIARARAFCPRFSRSPQIVIFVTFKIEDAAVEPAQNSIKDEQYDSKAIEYGF